MALLLASAGLLAWLVASLWSLRADPTPLPVAQLASDAVSSADAKTDVDVVGASTQRIEVDVGRDAADGVFVRVFDSARQPLPFAVVQLRYLDKVAVLGDDPFRSDNQRTNDDGRVHFGHPGPGRYEIRLRDAAAIRERFELGRGGRFDGELQLPPSIVATRGRLLRGSECQRGYYVQVLADGEEDERDNEFFGRNSLYSSRAYGAACDDDWVHLLLPVGVNTLKVYSTRAGVRPPAEVVKHALTVPIGSPRFEWELQLPGTMLEVVVVDETGATVRGFRASVHGKALPDDRQLSLTATTDGAVAPLGLVPAGVWNVSVQGDNFAPSGQTIETGAFGATRRVEFAVEWATTVRLQLESKRNRWFRPPPDAVPRLETARGLVHCLPPDANGYGLGSTSYRNVPRGMATLRCEDRIDNDEWVFLPFEPIDEVSIEVGPGLPNVLALAVESRPMVDIRACERGGREQVGATVTVFASERPVRSLRRRNSATQRWRSYLPAGQYRAVIEYENRTRDHYFLVTDRNLKLRLRP